MFAFYIVISLVQVRSYVFSTPICTGQHQVLMGLGPGFGAVPNGLGPVLDLLRFCCIVLAIYINSSFVHVRSYVFSIPTRTGQHNVLMNLGKALVQCQTVLDRCWIYDYFVVLC